MSRSKLKPFDNAKREEQQKKSNVKQLPPVDNLLDRPSKLEVYLNASEEEKIKSYIEYMENGNC